MAEPGFTAVPVEVPTAELARYENALCKREGLAVSAANAKASAASVILAAVTEQELAERVAAAPPITPPQ